MKVYVPIRTQMHGNNYHILGVFLHQENAVRKAIEEMCQHEGWEDDQSAKEHGVKAWDNYEYQWRLEIREEVGELE